MKKRFISAILSAAVILGAAALPKKYSSVRLLEAPITAAAESYNGFYYDILTNGNAEIYEYTGKASTLSIPKTINGHKVTAILSRAFEECNTLTSVTIPDTVTKIDKLAFMSCSNLSSVAIPSSVKTIGYGAFMNCPKLASVTLPKELETIESFAFSNCTSLTGITIPDSVVTIGQRAFNGCTKLSSATIGIGVQTIGSTIFGGSNSLKRIYCYAGVGEKYVKASGYDYTILIKLATPTVSAANGTDGVNVSWNKISNATGYTIYRKTDDTSWEKIGAVTGGSTLNFTDTSAWSNYTYYYTVRATSGASKSEFKSSPSIKFLRTPTVTPENVPSGVKISWTKTGGSAGYYVYRRTASSTWTKIADISSGSTLSYTDKTAKATGTYYYTVKAFQGSVKSSFKSSAALMHLKAPEVNPINGSTGVRVTWTKPAGAKGYIVYRKTASTSWERIASVTDASVLYYTDKDVYSGTTYYYTVKAVSGTYKSGFVSSDALRFLRAPIVTPINGQTGVRVTWTKSGCSSGYYIYRKTSSTSWTRIAEVSGSNTLYYTDKTAKSGTTYYYTVKSFYDGKTSAFNSSDALKYLEAPTVKASKVTGGINASWTKTNGASGYIVYRKSGSDDWKAIKTITSGSTVSFKDTTAKSGVTYYYTVRATSGTVKSAFYSSNGVKM